SSSPWPGLAPWQNGLVQVLATSTSFHTRMNVGGRLPLLASVGLTLVPPLALMLGLPALPLVRASLPRASLPGASLAPASPACAAPWPTGLPAVAPPPAHPEQMQMIKAAAR